MASIAEVVSVAVAVLGTGGIGKFFYDMVQNRRGRGKEKAEQQVVLVDSASNFAKSLMERLDLVQGQLDALRRETDTRIRQQDVLFRRHGRWDDEVRRRLHDLHEEVSEPPPLYIET